MNKVLSIVIPSYDVEKYIERCLDSMVVPQVLDKIEVLIINDGSKDRTPDLVKIYCEKYPNTFFLYNKENGGHGSTINYGLSKACGKYFKVVDGDDWLNSDELVAYISLLEERQEDVIASDFCCVQDETYKIIKEKQCTADSEQYGKAFSIDSGKIHEIIKMHSMTIKTEVLKKSNLYIDEHCFYVDMEYITLPIPFVNEIYFHNKYIYMYRVGRNGQSMDLVSMRKNVDQHLKVINRLLMDYSKNKNNLSQEKCQYIQRCIAQMVESRFQIYISMGLEKGKREELKAWDRKLLVEYPEVYYSTRKKSITMLRRTDYRIIGLGYLLLSLKLRMM